MDIIQSIKDKMDKGIEVSPTEKALLSMAQYWKIKKERIAVDLLDEEFKHLRETGK